MIIFNNYNVSHQFYLALCTDLNSFYVLIHVHLSCFASENSRDIRDDISIISRKSWRPVEKPLTTMLLKELLLLNIIIRDNENN